MVTPFYQRRKQAQGETEVKAGPWQLGGERKSLETGRQALDCGDQAGESGAACTLVSF